MFSRLYEIFQEYKLNLKTKIVKIDDIVWTYYDNENYEKPNLFIIHEFQSNRKYTWYPVLSYLTKHFRIIIPDNIGHGDTKIIGTQFKFTIDNYVDRIYKLLIVVLDNKRFHLFGISFGAMLSVIISSLYTNLRIKSLIIISPPGINDKKNNIIYNIYNRFNINFLVSKDLNDLEILNSLIFYNNIYNNKFILKKWVKENRKRYLIYNNIVENCFKNNEEILCKYLEKNKIPTLILWGKNDKLINSDNVYKIYKISKIKPDIKIFHKCGHLVQYEYPMHCAQTILNFIN